MGFTIERRPALLDPGRLWTVFDSLASESRSWRNAGTTSRSESRASSANYNVSFALLQSAAAYLAALPLVVLLHLRHPPLQHAVLMANLAQLSLYFCNLVLEVADNVLARNVFADGVNIGTRLQAIARHSWHCKQTRT